MATVMTILATIWAFIKKVAPTVWTYVFQFKWYIVTAILAVVIWQKFAPRSWVEPAAPWTVAGTAVSVDSGNSFTVKARAEIFQRTRKVYLSGVNVTPANNTPAQLYLTKLLGTSQVVLSVVSGSKFGAGDLQAEVYTSDGTCANLALVCKGLATCADVTHPAWMEAEETYGN